MTEPEVNHLSKCVTEQGGDQEPWGPSLVSCLCPLHSIHTLLKGAIFTTIMCLLLGKEAAGLEVTKGVCWGGRQGEEIGEKGRNVGGWRGKRKGQGTVEV